MIDSSAHYLNCYLFYKRFLRSYTKVAFKFLPESKKKLFEDSRLDINCSLKSIKQLIHKGDILSAGSVILRTRIEIKDFVYKCFCLPTIRLMRICLANCQEKIKDFPSDVYGNIGSNINLFSLILDLKTYAAKCITHLCVMKCVFGCIEKHRECYKVDNTLSIDEFTPIDIGRSVQVCEKQ